MVDSIVPRCCGATTHRKLNTYVIELQTSWQQTISCEIEPVADASRIYTLGAQRPVVVSSNVRNKV